MLTALVILIAVFMPTAIGGAILAVWLICLLNGVV